MKLRPLLLAAALALATPAQAQSPAQLAADNLRLEPGGRLIAEGSVEVLWQGNRLRATRLTYDRTPAGDRLDITGPILLEDADGSTILLADAAELSADLRDGLLTGARMVLDRRLQLAAGRITREDGRITTLERAVASACRVCPHNPVPLWEIRANRVTHDAETRQILFERAAFRLGGRTVAVIPRLRMPDPTVRRATGFLTPDVRSTSRLGPGIEVPYFIALRPDRDLTLTPRLHARGSGTLGLRYRQAFATGMIELEGALTRDRLIPGTTRGYLGATADFTLSPATDFGLRLRQPSDRTYLDDYGFGEEDPRENTAFIEHVTRDSLGRLRLTQFRSFRAGAVNDLLPNRVIEAGFSRRFTVPGLGGTGRMAVDALALRRSSEDPILGAGRDLARLTATADWRRDWILAGGVQAALLAEIQADRWQIRQDATFPASVSRISPAAALELRWPLVRAAPTGATHLIEPVAQLVWARRNLTQAPNEDSPLVELDEATLFQLHRAPGRDGREAGPRANLGIAYTRADPAGWSLTLAAGRVIRPRAQPASRLSGLSGRRSDWLAAARLETVQGLSLAGRMLLDANGHSPKQELRLAYTAPGLDLGASYVHLAADAAEDRPSRTTDLGLDGRVALTPNWTAQADLRYDLARREPGRAGIGASFRNECLRVDVSLSRRFVSSTSVAARTEFGLRVDLIGFGDSQGGPARPCMR